MESSEGSSHELGYPRALYTPTPASKSGNEPHVMDMSMIMTQL